MRLWPRKPKGGIPTIEPAVDEPLADSTPSCSMLPRVGASTRSLPVDRDSLSILSAVYEASLSSEEFGSLPSLLQERVRLEERLINLNKRVEKLSEDARERGDSFEERKLLAHVESLEDSDEAEVKRETVDSNAELVDSREKLRRSVETLARLEIAKSEVLDDLLATYEKLRGLLSKATTSRGEQAKQLVAAREEELLALAQATAPEALTSELVTDLSMREIDSFISELAESEGSPILKYTGDSVFNLNDTAGE